MHYLKKYKIRKNNKKFKYPFTRLFGSLNWKEPKTLANYLFINERFFWLMSWEDRDALVESDLAVALMIKLKNKKIKNYIGEKLNEQFDPTKWGKYKDLSAPTPKTEEQKPVDTGGRVVPVKREQGKKALINKVLRALNACFTKNKNVKKQAYTQHLIHCPECGALGDNDNTWCDRCYGLEYYYTSVDYKARNLAYSQKTSIIKWCIDTIQKNKLPIKYGKNLDPDCDYGVIYFEYMGRQVSFHDPKNQISCKPFAGSWTGVKNKKIPFHWIAT